jgi:membrane protein
MAGWRDVLIRTFGEIEQDNVVVVSAGVAFFALFASVPAMTALVSIYGLMSPPQEVATQVVKALPMLPMDVQHLIRSALDNVVEQSRGALSVGAVAGLAISFWTASRGTRAMLRAINIAYDEEESRRGIIRDNAWAYLFTVGAIVSAVLTFGLVVVLPASIAGLGLADGPGKVVSFVRWPLLFVLVCGSLAVLYRHGAIRTPPKWRWVWVGALSATVLWILCSMTLSAYITRMGHFRETYGPLGAVVVLLIWLYVSSFVIVMGAELNAELEHQTRRDTTVGEERPLGKRGAWVADNVGRCRPLSPMVRRTLRRLMGRGSDLVDGGAEDPKRGPEQAASDDPGDEETTGPPG